MSCGETMSTPIQHRHPFNLFCLAFGEHEKIMSIHDEIAQIGRMMLPDLRLACRNMGVSPAGSRTTLIDRLIDVLQGGGGQQLSSQPTIASAPPPQSPNEARVRRGYGNSGGGTSHMDGILGSQAHDYVDYNTGCEQTAPTGGTVAAAAAAVAGGVRAACSGAPAAAPV